MGDPVLKKGDARGKLYLGQKGDPGVKGGSQISRVLSWPMRGAQKTNTVWGPSKRGQESKERSLKFPGISENVCIYCVKTSIYILSKPTWFYNITISRNRDLVMVGHYDPMEKGQKKHCIL